MNWERWDEWAIGFAVVLLVLAVFLVNAIGWAQTLEWAPELVEERFNG